MADYESMFSGLGDAIGKTMVGVSKGKEFEEVLSRFSGKDVLNASGGITNVKNGLGKLKGFVNPEQTQGMAVSGAKETLEKLKKIMNDINYSDSVVKGAETILGKDSAIKRAKTILEKQNKKNTLKMVSEMLGGSK